MNKNNSPYTAAITGCSFLYYEFKRILPMLMSADAEKLLKDEVENNEILQINSRKARRTFMLENFENLQARLRFSFQCSYKAMELC